MDSSENVKRHRALGNPRKATEMEERMERHEAERVVTPVACDRHCGDGFQKDCAWCWEDAV